MYGKNSTVRRCNDCVARVAAAERANATAKQAQAQAQAPGDATSNGDVFKCAGCALDLPPSAYSRSQLLQKGEARRCGACISTAAPGRALLELGPSLHSAATPDKPLQRAGLRVDVEMSRLKVPPYIRSRHALRRCTTQQHQCRVAYHGRVPALAII
jgi:hypothetical protein